MAGETRHSSTPVSNLALFHSFSAELTDRQRSALAELAAGRPVTTAASAAGVHRSTLHNWLGHDPNFQAAYSALARHQAESASDLDTVARAALQALIAAPSTPAELRLRAIQTALHAVHSAPASAPALAPRPALRQPPAPPTLGDPCSPSAAESLSPSALPTLVQSIDSMHLLNCSQAATPSCAPEPRTSLRTATSDRAATSDGAATTGSGGVSGPSPSRRTFAGGADPRSAPDAHVRPTQNINGPPCTAAPPIPSAPAPAEISEAQAPRPEATTLVKATAAADTPLPAPADPVARAAFLATVRADFNRIVRQLHHSRSHAEAHAASSAHLSSQHPLVGQASFGSSRPQRRTADSAGAVISIPDGLQRHRPPEPIARNAPCPCGSKLKYKRCCGKTAQPVLCSTA